MANEPQDPSKTGDPFKSPDSPIKFSGNIPPAMRQALKNVKQEKAGTTDDIPHQTQARVTGSAQLEDLIEQLKETSNLYEEIKLPSGGMFYDGKDGPSDGILHIRAMTGEEEQILATPRWVRKGQAINMIFQRCLREKFRTDNFLSADRTYILIWLRGISYGSEYEVEVKCPECDRKFSTSIDLSALNVNYCPKNFVTPLQDTLPKSGFNFTYRLSRGRDENVVQEYRDRNLKMWGDHGADDTLIYRSALLVDDIQGLKDKQELVMLIKSLPIQDVSYLRNLITDPPFGVDTKCEITCAACFHEFDVELPLEANFFFPRMRKKKEETPA